MFIVTTPDHDDATQSADAVTAAATQGQGKPDVDALANAAFDQGVEAGSETHEPGKPPVDPTVTDDGVDDDGKPIVAPPAVKAAPKPSEPVAKPEAPPADDGEQDQPDLEIEKEIAAQGLKGNSAVRFRELANYRKTSEPMLAAAKDLGIESPEQFSQLRQVAEDGVAFRQVMEQSSASEDQFARAFSYLGAVNSKDPVMMRQAYDAMATEQKWLAEQLGIDLPGVFDPLDADPALKKRVTDGEVPRDVALQAVSARRTTALSEARSTATSEATKAAEAKQAGLDGVKAAAAKLVQDEGLDVFQAKQVQLAPIVAAIQQNFPPAQWAAEVDRLFRATPSPIKKAAPAPAPIRPNQRSSEGQFVAKPNSDMDAFDMGLAAAAEQGYGG